MKIKDFLIYLKNYGISQCYFNETIVGNFSEAVGEEFNDMLFNGIDFDLTANNYKLEKGCSYKSCDALIFNSESIDFIEFKRFKIKGNLTKNLSKIKEFDLESKLHDSYDLLKIINNEDVSHSAVRKKILRSLDKCFIFSIKYKGYKPSNKIIMQFKILEMKSHLESYLLSEHMPDNFSYKFIHMENLNSHYGY